mgnify:CR=1 FL=1
METYASNIHGHPSFGQPMAIMNDANQPTSQPIQDYILQEMAVCAMRMDITESPVGSMM